MSFRVSDFNFHSMFRKLTNVEMLNLKIGAETQDKIDIITLEKEGYRRLSLPNFKIQSNVMDFAEQNDSITHSLGSHVLKFFSCMF